MCVGGGGGGGGVKQRRSMIASRFTAMMNIHKYAWP